MQKAIIILASGSPRRSALLRQMGLEFEVIESDVDETTDEVSPDRIVLTLAERKCRSVAEKLMVTEDTSLFELVTADGVGLLVTAADTVVAYADEVLGKPHDMADARRMLMELSGMTHSVYTGVYSILLSLSNGQFTETDSFSFADKTDVTMYDFTESEAIEYIATGEPMDKAGAYGIQGKGAALVREIHGDYNNIVGFPLAHYMRELKVRGLV